MSERAISHAFGTPKPTLANSYGPELLNLRTFPTLMGYSSRILAESWESNLLYYAALADEMHIRPAELNVLIPEWTQKTVESIFASHLEDWPALLRSLRTGWRRCTAEESINNWSPSQNGVMAKKWADLSRRNMTFDPSEQLHASGSFLLVVALALAQERPTFRVKVDMVVLSFTDHRQQGPLH